jgi:predicted alpha/beta-fold hydrolase
MAAESSATVENTFDKQSVSAYRELVERFPANDFVPTGIFGSNPHWQTIVGSGALGGKLFGIKKRSFHTTDEEIATHDGDFFDVEFTTNIDSVESLVIIMHGLESTSRGELVTNFATALLAKGFGCCLPSFRGCSGKVHRYVKLYILF